MEKGAEKCEVFVNKDSAKEKYMKQVYGDPPFGDVAPSEEWKKEKEAEATTLKIKAAAYDAVKHIVVRHQELNLADSDAMCHISGALIMEETTMKTLI